MLRSIGGFNPSWLHPGPTPMHGTHIEWQLDGVRMFGDARHSLVAATARVLAALVQDGATGDVGLGRVRVHVTDSHHTRPRLLAVTLLEHPDSVLQSLLEVLLCNNRSAGSAWRWTHCIHSVSIRTLVNMLTWYFLTDAFLTKPFLIYLESTLHRSFDPYWTFDALATSVVNKYDAALDECASNTCSLECLIQIRLYSCKRTDSVLIIS